MQYYAARWKQMIITQKALQELNVKNPTVVSHHLDISSCDQEWGGGKKRGIKSNDLKSEDFHPAWISHSGLVLLKHFGTQKEADLRERRGRKEGKEGSPDVKIYPRAGEIWLRSLKGVFFSFRNTCELDSNNN